MTKLRDYYRLTPKERAQRAVCPYGSQRGCLGPAGPPNCESCAETAAELEIDPAEAQVKPGEYDDLTAARAQDQKGAMPDACQENTVDAGVRPCWEQSPNSSFRRCKLHGYLFDSWRGCSACKREDGAER